MEGKTILKSALIIGNLLISICSGMQAQGIQFVRGLSWAEVLKKAKKENKYIFVDCFTTWCGPCKAMDKSVYPDEGVGHFFNKNFLSIKIQMDKTKNDNDTIKKNYFDAEYFAMKYRIFSYPSYLFFSPDGVLIGKDIGLKQPANFITLAQTVLIPGRIYTDPFAEYNLLLAKYKSGNKDYSKLPYMITQARKSMEWHIVDILTEDYYQYLKKQPESILYNKENIEFLGSSIKSSDDPFFNLFFLNSDRVNKIIGNSFFSIHVVDPIILKEEADSVLGADGSKTGFTPAVIPVATNEPDWNKLYSTIKAKYNETCASRNVLNAKIKWYNNYQWWPQWIASFVEKVDRYGLDTTNELEDVFLSDAAWKIFLESNNPNQLKSAINWMNGICKRNKMSSMWREWDTYANLLYKAGRTQDALQWEEKALRYAKTNNDKEAIKSFSITIQTMRAGKPTWINYEDLVSQPFVSM